MLTNIWAKIDGYKMYGLGILWMLVAVVGHFWGPVSIGAMQIPAMDWPAAWDLISQGALIIAGKSAVAKLETKNP